MPPLVSLGHPNEIGSLSKYIYNEVKETDERKKVSLRLRDVLMKEWTLVGIPLVITAVASLAKAEKELGLEGQLEGDLSEKWQKDVNIASYTPRGVSFLQTLYAQNLTPIFATWGSHRADFEYLEKAVIYGLYLSDHTVLSAVESELVILTAIMCQGLAAPTTWHLRGMRRLGVSEEDVAEVQKGAELLARWAGRTTEGWVKVKDVSLE
ncbi:MAG: hypothetical protein LQ342_006446 [Letrouitia transgressa]|nr:MAG: hypothetical protein LQ342_006446 [Letrouitia transgressa]